MRCSVKKDVLKDFAILTAEQPRWNLFLIKLLKRDSNTGVLL